MRKNDRRTSLEHVPIGGIKQWLLIRGKQKDVPVLLFVHGGPGGAQIGFARHFQGILEEHFIVVNWDQRGAGLSYSKDIPSGSMRIDQFVSDLIEVTDYLRNRFLRKKIYLVGHSFGTNRKPKNGSAAEDGRFPAMEYVRQPGSPKMA